VSPERRDDHQTELTKQYVNGRTRFRSLSRRLSMVLYWMHGVRVEHFIHAPGVPAPEPLATHHPKAAFREEITESERCRGTWHIKDHVPILQRLRWGQLPFANLRYSNSPGDRLDWECGERTAIEEFKLFDCDWEGNHLRPRDIRPRKASELNVGNKDVWWDSIELREVGLSGCTPATCFIEAFGTLARTL